MHWYMDGRVYDLNKHDYDRLEIRIFSMKFLDQIQILQGTIWGCRFRSILSVKWASRCETFSIGNKDNF